MTMTRNASVGSSAAAWNTICAHLVGLWSSRIVSPQVDTSHAYTRTEFMEGVLRALKDRVETPLTELAVGERQNYRANPLCI